MAGTGFFESTSPGILSPETVGPLIWEPLQASSVAMRVSDQVTCESSQYRFPLVLDNPLAHWVAEGASLTEEDPTVGELVVVPQKLTALVKISREMSQDSINPGAAAIVGQGVVTQIQRQIDAAYFGSQVGQANQPAGLEDLVGHQTINIGGTFQDLTWAVEAESLLNRVGATATAYVASAATCEVLASLKKFSGSALTSNETLLQADPTSATKYQINGTPLYWVLEGVIPDGTVWALCKAPQPKAFVVMRQDVELITSPWPFFSDDCLALRAIMRFAFAWPHPAAVVQINGAFPGS